MSTLLKVFLMVFVSARKDYATHSASLEDLWRLARDKDVRVRREVAKNSNIADRYMLAYLARDRDKDVRWFVALHKNTPPKSLALLARDPCRIVRAAVAMNPNTPIEYLKLLAGDEDGGIRWIVTHKLDMTA